jgi:hypothetical protein
VDNLALGLLLGIDIITPKKISLNVAKLYLTFGYYGDIYVPVTLSAPATPKLLRIRAKQR